MVLAHQESPQVQQRRRLKRQESFSRRDYPALQHGYNVYVEIRARYFGAKCNSLATVCSKRCGMYPKLGSIQMRLGVSMGGLKETAVTNYSVIPIGMFINRQRERYHFSHGYIATLIAMALAPKLQEMWYKV